MLALQGAEIILIPTAIGYVRSEGPQLSDYHDSWQIVQRGHAVANACFLAAINRVGFEPGTERGDGIDFWGQSFVADPSGMLVAQASADEDEVVIASVDLDLVEAARAAYSFPFRDRRVDSYRGLLELFLD
jgi:N-carbamoylputrescine amidase